MKKSEINFRNGFTLVGESKSGGARKIPMKVTNKHYSLYVITNKKGLPFKDIKTAGGWLQNKAGGMAEWFKATVLKTDLRGFG